MLILILDPGIFDRSHMDDLPIIESHSVYVNVTLPIRKILFEGAIGRSAILKSLFHDKLKVVFT